MPIATTPPGMDRNRIGFAGVDPESCSDTVTDTQDDSMNRASFPRSGIKFAKLTQIFLVRQPPPRAFDSDSLRLPTSGVRPQKRTPVPLDFRTNSERNEDGDESDPRTAIPLSRRGSPALRTPMPIPPRARSPLASAFSNSLGIEGTDPPPSASASASASTSVNATATATTNGAYSAIHDSSALHIKAPSLALPPPTLNRQLSSGLTSPCFVHTHLDQSLSDFGKREEEAKQKRGRKERARFNACIREGQESASDESEGTDGSEEEEGLTNITKQLAETAVSVREMSKQLGRATVKSHVQSIMIITKARDNHLIRLTRELALWLMQTPRNGRDRGVTVYVDSQLRKSKRFDAERMERENPELFRPAPRRYSRSSSSNSVNSDLPKRPSPLHPFSEMPKNGANEFTKKTSGEEGQLRYWTNEMCSKSPHLFDYVVTLGGDGTVLYASWLFQHVVPPIIPFALGSLGFLTNFDFAKYSATLNNAIDNGIRVNLRMRFTCTVFRAIEGEENKNRRAVRSGKTGGIFMNSLTKSGWDAIEASGGSGEKRETKGKGRDKEIKCFSTRAVESFEVLNDLVVDRGPSPYVSLLELFGDEHHMTTVQADGLTVSTPTGSTAYSLSAGGSLVHPEIPALLITPICPHTLSFRPMLLPDSMELRICVPYNSRSTAWASFDGRGRVELRQGDHIKVTASAYPFPTVCADKQSTDWFHSISRTLRWNERKKQSSFVILEHGREKSKNTSEEEGVPEEPPSAEAIARENFGDEEDENENDEDEEDDEETYDEDEGFDIDDLSSENPTAASSPVVIPSDPPVERIPTLSRPPSADKDLTTMAALQDEQDRFQDPLPKPRRLSARHSQSPFKTHIPEPTPSRTLPNNSAASPRLTASTTRRRERGEEGDRDFINESLDFKRGVGGAGRRKALGKGQRAPSTRQQSESDPVGCFAVVGCDDFDSASQSDSER